MLKKEDLIGLYEILCNNLEDVPDKVDCSNQENEVYNEMQKLKEAIDRLG